MMQCQKEQFNVHISQKRDYISLVPIYILIFNSSTRTQENKSFHYSSSMTILPELVNLFLLNNPSINYCNVKTNNSITYLLKFIVATATQDKSLLIDSQYYRFDPPNNKPSVRYFSGLKTPPGLTTARSQQNRLPEGRNTKRD